MEKKAAIIGGGVIGGGWLARFLLNGWDVNLYDPDPESERKIKAVLENARHALPMLYDVNLPTEGSLKFCENIKDDKNIVKIVINNFLFIILIWNDLCLLIINYKN